MKHTFEFSESTQSFHIGYGDDLRNGSNGYAIIRDGLTMEQCDMLHAFILATGKKEWTESHVRFLAYHLEQFMQRLPDVLGYEDGGGYEWQ